MAGIQVTIDGDGIQELLQGAFLAEVHESWSTGWRYLKMDEYDAWKQTGDGAALTGRAA